MDNRNHLFWNYIRQNTPSENEDMTYNQSSASEKQCTKNTEIAENDTFD